MKLSLIVITKNNQATLKTCLPSLKPADEIIIVDDFSEDNTLKIARQYTDKIFKHKLESFPKQRHWAAAKAQGDWFMFIDADEQLTPQNWQEIKTTLAKTTHSAFRFARQNYFYGKKIRFGGYWPDYQTRLFKRSDFKGIKGVTHEQYLFNGTLGTLKQPVPHHPNRSIAYGLKKSLIWTPSEAQALFKAGHPQVTWWRLLKVFIWEFSYRYFKKLGLLDGYVGFVEAFIQAMNKFFIYQQLWELQQK